MFKLSHEVWSELPHFAEAYYEEASGKILLFALTDRGYRELSALLIEHGMEIPTEPDIRLHIPMGIVIKKALKRTPVLKTRPAVPTSLYHQHVLGRRDTSLLLQQKKESWNDTNLLASMLPGRKNKKEGSTINYVLPDYLRIVNP